MNSARNTIRTFALVCVGVTSLFLIGLSVWLVEILSAPNWCARAMGAAKEQDRPEFAVGGCYKLLMRQVEALSLNSHIAIGMIALCLCVLMVIVVAGGKLSFRGGKDGVDFNVERNDDARPE